MQCCEDDKLNFDIEENIINLILSVPQRHTYIFENIYPEYFGVKKNREIFEISLELFKQKQEINYLSVCQNSKADITQYLMMILTKFYPLSVSTKFFVKQIYQNFIENLTKSAQNIKDFDKIKEYESREPKEQILDISTDAEQWDNNYKKRQETILTSGFMPLDNMIGSFCGGDYIALGGSTGIGKTAIALNIAKMICCQGRKVLYCSLEMPLEQLQNRFVCMIMGLSAFKYRTCGFNNFELLKYKDGLKSLKEWGLKILTDYNLTIPKLETHIQQIKPEFVIIDYLGLVNDTNSYKSLYEKTTAISRQIKILATKANIPVLTLVQLNRDFKTRQDKRPVLSDIRESGAIEQDADIILFAHREGIYNEAIPKNKLNIIVAKNRHGASNISCNLNFNLETQVIS